MAAVAFIPILFMLIVVPLILLFIAAMTLIFRGRRGTANQAETMRQLERTWTLLEKMEGRITNLETILIERGRPAAEAKGEPRFHA
jgi:hypothetical protein